MVPWNGLIWIYSASKQVLYRFYIGVFTPPMSYCHIFLKEPPKYVIKCQIFTKGPPSPLDDDIIYVQPLLVERKNLNEIVFDWRQIRWNISEYNPKLHLREQDFLKFIVHSVSAVSCFYRLDVWESVFEGVGPISSRDLGCGDVTLPVISSFYSQMVKTEWSGTQSMIFVLDRSVISVTIIGLANHWSWIMIFRG